MTDQQSNGDSPSKDLLLSAREQFERTRRALRDVLVRIEAGDAAAVSALDGCRLQLSKALNNAIEQEAKLEELCRAKRGAAGGYAIDFDAARSEIGRRLACLRAAGQGESLPCDAE